MVDRITSSLAREAVLAAVQRETQSAQAIRADASRLFEASIDAASLERSGETRGAQGFAAAGPGATDALGGLKEGFFAVDRELRAASAEGLAQDLLSGKITDFHEVATRVNRARISFEFAMEIRNKLIDAYRETMRMSV